MNRWEMWDRNLAGQDVFWGAFDGGKKENGSAGAGWLIKVWQAVNLQEGQTVVTTEQQEDDEEDMATAPTFEEEEEEEEEEKEGKTQTSNDNVAGSQNCGFWRTIHEGSLPMAKGTTSMAAELKACEMLTLKMLQVGTPSELWENCFSVHLGCISRILEQFDIDCRTLCLESRKK